MVAVFWWLVVVCFDCVVVRSVVVGVVVVGMVLVFVFVVVFCGFCWGCCFFVVVDFKVVAETVVAETVVTEAVVVAGSHLVLTKLGDLSCMRL